MEKQLRSVVCPDHNLRYDPAVADGCVRCMRLPGTTGAGRVATPAPKAAANAGAKTVATIVLVFSLVLGWLLTRTTTETAPEGAFVEPDRRFALVVPKRWKIVDPSMVTYLRDYFSADDAAATLISDKGRLAPTVFVEIIDGSPGPATASETSEFEKAFREGWEEDASLKMKVGLATVDRIRSFHLAATSERGRQKIAMDHYLVPGRDHSYLITAVILADKPGETASAARAVADGFRVLERPAILVGKTRLIVLGVLLAAMIASARRLATT